MQLDKTQIVIRERSFLETLDLSLQVIRSYARPLAISLAVGAAPMLLANYLLVGWMADIDLRDESPIRYIWAMTVLVFLEAPWASALANLYIGNALFHQPPTLRQMLRKVFRSMHRLALCHGVMRLVFPAWLVLFLVFGEEDFDPVMEFVLLGAFAFLAAGIRAFRPFANEIILLEETPFRRRGKNSINYSRRSNMLHLPSTSDLLGTWCCAAVLGVFLTASLYGSCLFISGIFFNRWDAGAFLVFFCLPAAMWLTAGFFAVVRFLSYLDLRIRQEGWEVELLLRAEASQLAESRR